MQQQGKTLLNDEFDTPWKEVLESYFEDFLLFFFHYRIFDRYDRPVVSVAVLADHRPGWRPDSFSWELWGCQVGIQFPTVKLLDYSGQWSALESSNNPFAICTMAHLKTL